MNMEGGIELRENTLKLGKIFSASWVAFSVGTGGPWQDHMGIGAEMEQAVLGGYGRGDKCRLSRASMHRSF